MPATFPSFGSFIFKDNLHRKYVYIAAIAAIIQLIIFKLCYPFADFFSDSYSYIFAAANHLDVNIWPIGYSKFLWLFHQVTTSDTAVVAFQYLFVQGITLYFFFTLLYFYAPKSESTNIIFFCLFFNPLILYLSNYISSDALFLGLSLWWATQLLWIIHRPRPYQVILHGLLIAITFTLRYNAMYYPLVSAIVLLFSQHKLAWKVTGIALPLLLITLFVNHTQNSAYKITGAKQFSIFGGWQLANNALYMYPYINTAGDQAPATCREFDQEVKRFFEKYGQQAKSISPRQGAVYIKLPEAPLKKFLTDRVNTDNDSSGGVQSWGTVAPIYGSYGKALILQHPIAFARYFLLPNTLNYALPPLEKLEIYNLGQDKVAPIAAQWFHYPDTQVSAVSIKIQGVILLIFPSLFLIINLFFIWTLLRWIQFKRIRPQEIPFKQALLILILLLTVNAGFSILASPIVFRYQIFPMLLCFSFTITMIGKLEALMPSTAPAS
ncbi:hypothetical protein ACDQ55_20625 [Chitinophaga sp. 30R24]|uniref:hypothetical protein n=1 Tax=Chitinophaga sp. 30R24 TaxID=3248838 RepID=UPI003B91EC2A